jgi:hypothetical protein
MDTVDRLPKTGDKGITLKQQLKDKLIEHKHNISTNTARTCMKSATGGGAWPNTDFDTYKSELEFLMIFPPR